jgi:hypothetical protein
VELAALRQHLNQTRKASAVDWAKAVAFARGIKEAAPLLLEKCTKQEELQAVQFVYLILENVQDALKALDQDNASMGLSTVLGGLERDLRAMKKAYEDGDVS